MRTVYFLLFAFCFGFSLNAQIVNIPDVNLKNYLTTAVCADFNNDGVFDGDVDIDNDGLIQVSEALSVQRLTIINDGSSVSELIELTGISSFLNLKTITISGLISIQNIDLSQLILLNSVYIGQSNSDSIQFINLSNLSNLQNLVLSGLRPFDWSSVAVHNKIPVNLNGCLQLDSLNYSNSLVTLNFCQIPNLKNLNCNYLEGGEPDDGIFDFSCLTVLETLDIGENVIDVLILKNGSLLNSIIFPYWDYIPYPRFICIDDNSSELQQIQSLGGIGPNTVINDYCNFNPGGTIFIVQGNQKFDSNENGCDTNDPIIQNLQFNIASANQTYMITSDSSGNYELPIFSEQSTISPIIENPTYFSVSPQIITVDFPTNISPFNQNFCISPNGIHNDVEVVIIPISAARPGFDSTYKIIYKNKGTHLQSGTLNLIYNDAVLDFVSSNPMFESQSTNNFNWLFTNLQPFESREILLTLNLNSPLENPAVNSGYLLQYTATITAASDETPENNVSVLNQIVVNSFDPNDKTCLEGETISLNQVGKDVHYTIRFENTGTADAQNVVVKDMIDTTKFDIATLVPIDGSHSFQTKITNTNKVEFIFENIQLPFDDTNNDGYVTFKIKTKPSLVLGNTFSNTASIYFDYNFPIITNTTTTTISNVLANQDFDFVDYFSINPNPTKDILTIQTKENIDVTSINIYNTLGQLVLLIPNAKNITTVDVSSLKTGNYFIIINSDKGISSEKFIKY